MHSIITLAGIDEAISNLRYSEKALKHKLIQSIRSFYVNETSIDSVVEIPSDELIQQLWDTGHNPMAIKNRRKNLSSVKSSINADLNRLHEEGNNSEGIIIGPANVFDMSDEAKTKMLERFTYEATGDSPVPMSQVMDVLKTVNQILARPENDGGNNEKDGLKKLDQLKEIIQSLSEKVGLGGSGQAAANVEKWKGPIGEIKSDVDFTDTEDDLEEIEFEEDLEEALLEVGPETEDVIETPEVEDEIEVEDQIEEINPEEQPEAETIIDTSELEDELVELDVEEEMDDMDPDEPLIPEKAIETIEEDAIQQDLDLDEDTEEVLLEEEPEEIDVQEDMDMEEDLEEIDEEDDLEESVFEEDDEIEEEMTEPDDEAGLEKMMDEEDDETIFEPDPDEVVEEETVSTEHLETNEIDHALEEADLVDESVAEEIIEDAEEEGDSDAQDTDEDTPGEYVEEDPDTQDFMVNEGAGRADQEIDECFEDVDLQEGTEEDIIEEMAIEDDEEDLDIKDDSEDEAIEKALEDEFLEDADAVDEPDVLDVGEDLEETELEDEFEVDEIFEGVQVEEDLQALEDDEELEEEILDKATEMEVETEEDLELLEDNDLEEMIEDAESKGAQEKYTSDDGEEVILDEGVDGLDISLTDLLEEYSDEGFMGEDGIRKAKFLAEGFNNALAAMDKYYNQYILIPAGEYTVGAKSPKNGERPLKKTHLEPFYFGKFPVTNALFEIFVEKTGYKTTAEKIGYGIVYHGRYQRVIDEKTGLETFDWRSTLSSDRVDGACWYQPSGPGSTLHNKRNHPVVQVTREDAMAFAAWTGKRLPTEDEWEAAARTARGHELPWGSEPNPAFCNIEESYIGDTTPVDQYKKHANAFGIADTIGNILEWTIELSMPSPGQSGQERIYSFKGGSWISGRDVRLFSRIIPGSESHSNIIGFRCVAY